MGKPVGPPAARAGMPSARRWRCTRSARRLTSLAGGGDLRFPHHACQAALAEAFTRGHPVRPRPAGGRHRPGRRGQDGHPGGNLVLVGELLDDYPAAAVRLLILDRRWDQDWDYEPGRPGRGGVRGWSGCRPRPDALTAPRQEMAVRRWRRPCGAGQRPRRARRAAHRRGRRRPGRPRPRLAPRTLVAGRRVLPEQATRLDRQARETAAGTPVVPSVSSLYPIAAVPAPPGTGGTSCQGFRPGALRSAGT